MVSRMVDGRTKPSDDMHVDEPQNSKSAPNKLEIIHEDSEHRSEQQHSARDRMAAESSDPSQKPFKWDTVEIVEVDEDEEEEKKSE